MSVLACDKRGCYSIMCNTCINGSYYICENCKKDFKDWLKRKSELYLDSKVFIYEKLEEFMREDKNPSNNNIPNNFDEIIDDFLKDT